MGTAHSKHGGADWLQTWTSPGTGTFRIGRYGERWIAEWVDIATLSADRDGSRVQFEMAPGCDEAWARKLRDGPAAALIRHLAGGITMHASAVGLGGAGTLLLGESGSGKSTFAADLCERDDAVLLADDAAALVFRAGSIDVCPTERFNWLDPNARPGRGPSMCSGTRKVPFPARCVASGPLPLCAMIKLTFDDAGRGCEVTRLTGGSAFALLSASQFRFVIDEPEATLRDFEYLERLASLVPLYEFRRPRALAAQPVALAAAVSVLSAVQTGRREPSR